MSSPPEQPVPEGASTAADSGLRCPQCEYNLTGLSENRCPECGATFDPDELRRVLAGEPGPIPGWDDRLRANPLVLPVAFVGTCCRTWLRPEAFAKSFPSTFSVRSVTVFWLLVRAAAATVLWGGGILIHEVRASQQAFGLPRDLLRFLVVITAAGIAGSLSCEAALVCVLTVAAKRRITPEPSLQSAASWWGFVGMHSSFLIISAATCGLIASTLTDGYPGLGRDVQQFLLPAVILDVVWWWYCVSRGVAVRCRPTWGRAVAIVLIPVTGLVGIVAGTIACGCCVFGGLR